MQKLKSYISALIEAAFGKKKAFIGAQAMPKYNSPVNHTSVGTYIAPFDGYIQLHAGVGSANDEVQLGINGSRIQNLIATQQGNWLDFIAPVHKGDSCETSATGAGTTATVRFYQTIGGGA